MTRRLLGRLGALVLIAAAGAGLRAQPLELLGDLVAEGSTDDDVFGAQPIGVVNGKALLSAPSSGTLWASDGSAAGTLAIADFGFSGDDAGLVVASSPQCLYLLNADGGGIGGRVLRTDGTRPGTFFLRDDAGVRLIPGIANRAAAGDHGGLYLFACTSDTRCGIWFNDGATPTSQLLVPLDRAAGFSIPLVSLGDSVYWVRFGGSDSQVMTTSTGQPGARPLTGAFEGYLQGPMAFGGRLYFAARTTAGEELWTSDGTSAGTTVLTSFPSASPFLHSPLFQVAAGRVYFIADDDAHGQEVWSTDGTVAGTRRETDFGHQRPFGSEGQAAGQTIGVVGGRLIFGAFDAQDDQQLWSSLPGSAPVPLLDSCGADCSPLARRGLLVAAGRAFFVAADPSHGNEMWSTDGTKAGTQLLVDSCPGSCNGWEPWDTTLRVMVAGDRVVFWTAHDLWLTDGTAAGTHSLFHTDENLLGLVSRLVVALGTRLLFTGLDPAYGAEVHVADPATGAVELLVPMYHTTESSLPRMFTSFGNRVLFSALSSPRSGGSASLWVTDGTAGGTTEVPAVALPTCDGSGALCPPFTVAGGNAFFVQRDEGFRRQLWRTDATVAGTLQLTHNAESLFSDYFSSVALADKLYFSRDTYPGGAELWSSDGTPAGTVAVLTLPEVRLISALTAVGSELYFISGGEGGTNLWRSDGTLAGTHQVTAFGPGAGALGPALVRAGNAVWFLAGLGTNELWRTDGTPAGTRLVAHPDAASDLVSFQEVLYFFAQASPVERALYRVNEQQDGITEIVRFPGFWWGSDAASGLKVFQGNLYFVGNSAGEGSELWHSDGTTTGTRIVRDVNPGVDGSAIASLVVTAQWLFFGANDGIHGQELWRTDGTAQGTQLVHDLWPGPSGSSPSAGAVAGSHLVLGATGDLVGHEPWSLDLLATRSCVASATTLCLNGGRFRVTADWEDFSGNRGPGHAVPLSADTGYFWFFGADNVEVMVKVLDGHGVNGHDWVFYGALSSVEYTLTVTDTQTGAVRRYFNPSGRLASVGDTQGFGPLGGYARTPPSAPAAPASVRRIASGDTSPCVASEMRLCLNGGRFAVEAAWKDFAGHTGVGHTHALTGDTGYFWFFSDTNVEVVIKVLDGTLLNGKFWLFYGALSSVEYTLTVRDTVTGTVRVYRNASGHMASVGDTSAF